MATYDYLCRTCDQILEVRASFAEKAEGLQPTCPSCKGEDLRRLFTPVSVGSASGGGELPRAGGGGGGGDGYGGGGGCCGGGCGCG